MGIGRALAALSDFIDAVVRVVVAAATMGFALLLFANVLGRYFFAHPLTFSEELGKLLFVWSAFLAATIAYKKDLHIRFEFINKLIGEKGVRITNIAAAASALVFFALCIIYGVQFTRIVWPTYLPVMGISQGWLYTALVAGSAVFEIHALRRLWESIKG